MGPLGVQEMMAIFVIALLLFGPKKLPELGRMLGKALSEFRRAKNELKATFESHLSELERETRSETQSLSPKTDYSSVQYPYAYDEYGQYEPYDSHENGISEPSTASATATLDAEAHRDQSSSQNSAVAGTVARSNGVQPLQPASVTATEEHPA